ncbi:hypothetical protein DPMN_085098 [Dreissena polymorpha]|uniref:Uncharacterized protein n=1 Tax=Dreissena polymorpha TaxID=45954 RepID=A0A9D3YC53_DREPO|nr:hypothetical protein DPMN_085098 [Dreissena polymorpha]
MGHDSDMTPALSVRPSRISCTLTCFGVVGEVGRTACMDFLGVVGEFGRMSFRGRRLLFSRCLPPQPEWP